MYTGVFGWSPACGFGRGDASVRKAGYVGGPPFPVFREVSQIWRSDDPGGSSCTPEGLYHDAGKVPCKIQILYKTAKSGKSNQIPEGGTEMTALTIEHLKRGSLSVRKITGFTEKQLSELNSMDFREMKQTIQERLTASRQIPYGVFIINAWISGDAVFIETGVSPNC